jgi:RNA polymerase sigma factor (sigma-70 family)
MRTSCLVRDVGTSSPGGSLMCTPPAFRDDTGAALCALYRCHRERLCSVAQRYVGSPDDAEDAVQVVFLRILRRQGDIDTRIGYRYLHRAVVNEALHQSGRLRRSRRILSALRCEGPQAAASPEEELRCRVLEMEVAAAIGALPPRCRSAFQLARIECLSYAEAAARMGVSVKTIQEHLLRANRVLQIRLAAHAAHGLPDHPAPRVSVGAAEG